MLRSIAARSLLLRPLANPIPYSPIPYKVSKSTQENRPKAPEDKVPEAEPIAQPGFFARLGNKIKNNPFLSAFIIGSSSLGLITLGFIALCAFFPPAAPFAAGILLGAAKFFGLTGLFSGLSVLNAGLASVGIISSAALFVTDTVIAVAKGISVGISAIKAKRAAVAELEIPAIAVPLAIAPKAAAPAQNPAPQAAAISPSAAAATVFFAALAVKGSVPAITAEQEQSKMYQPD